MLLGIDSTEEKIQLQKHEAIVQSVNSTGISLELDINGNLQHCNKNFIDLFRISQKEMKSITLFDVIHPIELESFNKRWDSIIHGSVFTGVLHSRSTKGDEIWLNGSFNIIRNTAHETEHIVFVGVDITHEKKVETELQVALETLKKQERQLREAERDLGSKLRETKLELLSQFKEIEKTKNLNEKMLEEMADAVITAGQDNRIVFFNKAAEKLWQIDRKEIMDQDIGVLFPESLTEKEEILGSLTRPGNHKITGKRRKTVIIDKSGKRRPVFVLITKARVEGESAYMAFFQSVD
jgi:PAS domain S-box-containing protein